MTYSNVERRIIIADTRREIMGVLLRIVLLLRIELRRVARLLAGSSFPCDRKVREKFPRKPVKRKIIVRRLIAGVSPANSQQDYTRVIS